MLFLRGENNKILLLPVKISDNLPYVLVKISDILPHRQQDQWINNSKKRCLFAPIQ
jgi:hypothetical protein